MNLFNELLMHVHELYMNMHERSSSDELHFSGEGPMTLCWALTKNDLLSLIYNKRFHSCEVENFFKEIYSLMDVSTGNA